MEEYEADVVCSALAKYKLVHAVLSNDMDMLAYGCPIILRDFTFKKDTINEYNTSKFLKIFAKFKCIIYIIDFSSKGIFANPLLEKISLTIHTNHLHPVKRIL